MIYLCFILLLFTGCSMNSFIRKGYAPFCLVDYTRKVIDCSYATMDDCEKAYSTHLEAVCFADKYTNKGRK